MHVVLSRAFDRASLKRLSVHNAKLKLRRHKLVKEWCHNPGGGSTGPVHMSPRSTHAQATVAYTSLQITVCVLATEHTPSLVPTQCRCCRKLVTDTHNTCWGDSEQRTSSLTLSGQQQQGVCALLWRGVGWRWGWWWRVLLRGGTGLLHPLAVVVGHRLHLVGVLACRHGGGGSSLLRWWRGRLLLTVLGLTIHTSLLLLLLLAVHVEGCLLLWSRGCRGLWCCRGLLHARRPAVGQATRAIGCCCLLTIKAHGKQAGNATTTAGGATT